jgi:hypothetical protein
MVNPPANRILFPTAALTKAILGTERLPIETNRALITALLSQGSAAADGAGEGEGEGEAGLEGEPKAVSFSFSQDVKEKTAAIERMTPLRISDFITNDFIKENRNLLLKVD